MWDRGAGALVGVVGVLTLLWMTIPSLTTAEGWPARVSRSSAVVSWVDNLAPRQPARFAAWGRRISEAPYPTALGPLDDPPDPGRPPNIALSTEVDRRVRESIVKVTGDACSQTQAGSGWVAAPGLVVTNAHVVAGETTTRVEDANRVPHDAEVVAFDADRDIAVLRVADLDARKLPLATAKVHDIGAVYGHPGGKDLRVAPARIGEEIVASGTDIYRTKQHVRRRVFVLAARLHPGDSGAPLVNTAGAVVGVAFAIDPAHGGTAYAVTDKEVTPVLREVSSEPVNTGDCLV
jgi:S1-C subfamily serine protease